MVKMTNCIICHKTLIDLDHIYPVKTDDFVCVCFDCIKKQTKSS